MSERRYLLQGIDKLCGIYACLNCLIKATDGVCSFHRSLWETLFLDIIDDLHQRRYLNKVHQNGSSPEQVEKYLEKLKSELADDVIVTYSRPFDKCIDTETLLKKLKYLSRQPQTAVILSISGKYNHWSVLDKIVKKRLYLHDSINLKYLNTDKIGDIYDIEAEEIFVVGARKNIMDFDISV